MSTTVAGESVNAFVPPSLTLEQLATLTKPLRQAEAALATRDFAGEMIPSLDWSIYAFVRKEALLPSASHAQSSRRSGRRQRNTQPSFPSS